MDFSDCVDFCDFLDFGYFLEIWELELGDSFRFWRAGSQNLVTVSGFLEVWRWRGKNDRWSIVVDGWWIVVDDESRRLPETLSISMPLSLTRSRAQLLRNFFKILTRRSPTVGELFHKLFGSWAEMFQEAPTRVGWGVNGLRHYDVLQARSNLH